MATWDGYNKQIAANRFQQTFVINHIDLSGRLLVRQDASLNSRLLVVNDASFMGNVFVNGNVIANSKFILNEDASLNSRLFVANDASFMGNVFVNGNTIVNSKFILNQDASLNSRLFVANDASFMGNVFVNGNFLLNGDASFNSNVFLMRDISCNSNVSIGRNLIVSGNLEVKNYTNQNIINTTTTNYQLVVAEDISLNGRLAVSGHVDVNGNVSVNSNIGINVVAPVGLVDISGSLVRTTILPTGNLYIGATTAISVFNSGSETSYPPVFVLPNKSSNTIPDINSLTIENANNTSSTAHATLLIENGGTGGGDPYVSLDNGGDTGWSHGINNATGHFHITNRWRLRDLSIIPIMAIKNISGFVGGYSINNPLAFLHLPGNGSSTNYNNSPDAGPSTAGYHNLILSTASSASYNYGMSLGVDTVTGGFGYINVGGPAAYRPLCLQTTGGNVGIGTTNPLEKLHINGGLKVGGGSRITGIDAGQFPNSPSVGSGTVTFNITFPSVPVVFTTIRASTTHQIFAVHVGTVTTTSFGFNKTWKHITVANQGGAATAETFNWVAISFT